VDVHSASIADRFKRLYSPAICDALDDLGFRHQAMDHTIRPLEHNMVVAGPAFTIVGRADASTDTSKRMGPTVIDQFRPGVVAVYATNGESRTGVWGELWAAGAAARGCVGAVVDGGIRDTGFLRRANFQIFHRFTAPYDAVGRFTVVDYEVRTAVGGVLVSPGDYIFGDEDGIVVVPQEVTMQVLEAAEIVSQREDRIREEIGTGRSLAQLYRDHGKF
jgi:4-hydroxy-4-methyl-2-oxoglutarate aldolase